MKLTTTPMPDGRTLFNICGAMARVSISQSGFWEAAEVTPNVSALTLAMDLLDLPFIHEVKPFDDLVREVITGGNSGEA